MNHCGLCKVELTKYRCYAVERILKTMKLVCKHAPYGCKEVVKCFETRAHQRSCMYQPCVCPQKGCNFTTNSMVIGEHFKTNHQLLEAPFPYNKTFITSIHFHHSVTTLQAQDDDKLFVITNKVDHTGNIINLYHIGLNRPNLEFVYRILVSSFAARNIIQFRSKVKNILNGIFPTESEYLLVPFEFFRNGWLTMRIHINVVANVEPQDNS